MMEGQCKIEEFSEHTPRLVRLNWPDKIFHHGSHGPSRKGKGNKRIVVGIDRDGGEWTFDSTGIAAAAISDDRANPGTIKTTARHIAECCRGKTEACYGYRWRYEK
jgi:hypothetical protein